MAVDEISFTWGILYTLCSFLHGVFDAELIQGDMAGML